MDSALELLVDQHALVGEGPLWDEQAQVLYWVDILSSKLFIYDPASGQNREFDVGQHVGTVVTRASGGLMLAVQNGFAAFDLDTEELTLIVDPEAHIPGNRFNDGKCDPAGRLWAGTMAYENPQDSGSLYRLDTDMSVHRIFGGVAISNGIIWSLDHTTMYYIDTLAKNVRAFDYDNATGDIANERAVVTVPDEVGMPDGMTIDVEGMLWVAHYGGSCVCRWHPDTGELLEKIELPVTQVTACAFGGPNLDTLYITSAAQELDAEELARQPLAGALFRIKTAYQGVPSFRFGG
jgi:sugar lactone lactonase YvrE